MNRNVLISLVAAAGLSALPNLFAQESFTVKNVTFQMVPITNPRTFKMGATMEQREDSMPDEFPEHTVNLSEYALGQTEVTQALWKAVMGNNPSLFQVQGPGGDELPVENVSYDDCLRFIARLNELTGRKFRLPTEAEWECAARGQSNSLYPTALGNIWYADNSGSRPHKVRQGGWGGSSSQSHGLFNLSGNVAEWCSDWKGPYTESNELNPQGPKTGTERVCRGGSWADVAWRCRTSSRNSHAPSFKASNLGFRLAMSLTSTLAFYRHPVVHGEVKDKNLQLLSVEVTDKATLLNMYWTGKNSSSYCYIERSACIVDRNTGKTYTITQVRGDMTFRPDKTFVGTGMIKFTLVFPPIPVGCTSIDFIESSYSSWNLTDIELR